LKNKILQGNIMRRIPPWLIILAIFLTGCAIVLLIKLKNIEIKDYQAVPQYAEHMNTHNHIADLTNQFAVSPQPTYWSKTISKTLSDLPSPGQSQEETSGINAQSYSENVDIVSPGIGVVLMVRGSANAVHPRGTRRPLFNRISISCDEILETTQGSRIKIKLNDGTQITLGEATTVSFDVFNYKPSEPPGCNIIVRIINGLCRILPGRIALLNQHGFVIRTETATFRLTGGDVCVICSETGGEVLVLNAGSGGVVTEYCQNGQPVMNIKTGTLIPVPKDEIIVQTITTTNAMFSVTTGKGSTLRTLDISEVLHIANLASILRPISFNVAVAPEGTVLIPEGKEKGETNK